MKACLAVLSLLSFSIRAQDAEPMTAEHAALRAFAGHWHTQMTLRAPGKAAVATTLTERFELVCNGLWLKRVVDGARTISLLGFDPHAKTYVSVEASSTAPAASRATGSFDLATKTWTWRTVAGEGPARSTGVWQDDDTFVETGYGPGTDGKEAEVLKITRTRVNADAPPPAPTGGGAAPAIARAAVAQAMPDLRQPMHAELGVLVGRWDAVTRTSLPGAPASEDQGKEVNSAVCNGLWVWSDFDGTLSGKPFEGHALIGYDAASAEVVTFWIDSSTAALSIRTGSFDAKTRTLTATGTVFDPAGKPLPLRETAVWTDAQSRSQVLRIGSGERAPTIEIAFTRDMQLPDHRIR